MICIRNFAAASLICLISICACAMDEPVSIDAASASGQENERCAICLTEPPVDAVQMLCGSSNVPHWLCEGCAREFIERDGGIGRARCPQCRGVIRGTVPPIGSHVTTGAMPVRVGSDRAFQLLPTRPSLKDLIERYHRALFLHDKEWVLLEVRSHLRSTGARPSDEAFVEAARIGRSEVVKMLLDYGANPNAFVRERFWFRDGRSYGQSDELNFTALMAALSNDHSEVVQLLLSRDADANLCPGNSNAPLFWCASNPGLMRLMLQAGADPSCRNRDGDTVLDVVTRRSGYDDHCRDVYTPVRRVLTEFACQRRPIMEVARQRQPVVESVCQMPVAAAHPRRSENFFRQLFGICTSGSDA